MKKTGLYLCLLTGLCACGKGADKEPTATEKLQQGSWQLKSWTSRRVFQNQSTSTDNYALTDNCVRDNRYTFGADGRLSLDEGASRCSAADPQHRDAGSWRLLNGDRQLQSGILGGPATAATIEELSESALQLSTDTTFYFGSMSSRLITTARFER